MNDEIDVTKPLSSPRTPVVASVPDDDERRVLLVEQDPDTQYAVARMLTVQGARVVGTSSGEAALMVIAQWPANLVLIDEGMGGLELARRIRSAHPDIPVVLTAKNDSPELRLAARVAGVLELLVKPFRIESIRELLARLFELGVSLVPAPDLAPAE